LKRDDAEFVIAGVVAAIRISVSQNVNDESSGDQGGGDDLFGKSQNSPFNPRIINSPSANSNLTPSPSPNNRGISPSANVAPGSGQDQGDTSVPSEFEYENELLRSLCGLFSLIFYPSHHVKKEVALLVKFLVQYRPYLVRPILHYFIDHINNHPNNYYSSIRKYVQIQGGNSRSSSSSSSSGNNQVAFYSFMAFTSSLLTLFLVDEKLIQKVEVGQMKYVQDPGFSLFYFFFFLYI
jgi:hypothetical protein